MEKFLPWDLEKITRQYLGFNDHVIKEYHKLFQFDDDGAFPNSLCLRPTVSTGFVKVIILQWRSALFINYSGFKHIYTFHHITKAGKYMMTQDIVSKPAVLFKANPYRASVLK